MFNWSTTHDEQLALLTKSVMITSCIYLFQFARLARDLKFPGGVSTSRSNADTSCYSDGEITGEKADDDGDDAPSGLCWFFDHKDSC